MESHNKHRSSPDFYNVPKIKGLYKTHGSNTRHTDRALIGHDSKESKQKEGSNPI